MHQLNKVEPADIANLGPEQLVRLLDVLLHAEARDRLIAKHGVFVPYQIYVPDGGRDGKWDNAIEPYEYIPRGLTYYQCKAQELSDGDCRSELLRVDTKKEVRLKEKVDEVLSRGGAYVFFSGRPCVNIDNRVTAARKALSDAGRTTAETDCIDFFDANRIAAWVNLHAAAFAYVCQQVFKWQAVGLRTVEDWGADPIFHYDFQTNDYIAEQIQNVRQWLATSGNIARVTGPSGLGKTRIGFEVFACKSIGDEQLRKALTSSTVCVDVQTYGEQVLGWVDQLSLYGL